MAFLTSAKVRKSKFLSMLLLVSGAVALMSGDAVADQIAYITGNNVIWAWDVTTNSLSTVDTVSPGVGLDSLMFDSQGNIVYDSYSSNSVGRYNVTTHANTSVTGSFVGPADMALEPGGTTALIGDAGGTSITRVDLTTSAAIGTLSVGFRPDGIIYDNTGRLFVVLNFDRVAQINPVTGAVISQVMLPGPLNADGMTFDAATGMLYVSSDNGGFYTLSPSNLSNVQFTALPYQFDGIASIGNDLLFVVRGVGAIDYNLLTQSIITSPGIAGADDIAPLAGPGAPPPSVPEPLTLSLFAAGLAGAAAIRRRKPKA